MGGIRVEGDDRGAQGCQPFDQVVERGGMSGDERDGCRGRFEKFGQRFSLRTDGLPRHGDRVDPHAERGDLGRGAFHAVPEQGEIFGGLSGRNYDNAGLPFLTGVMCAERKRTYNNNLSVTKDTPFREVCHRCRWT